MLPVSHEPILRPFQPDDYPQLHALHRAADPTFALALEELQQHDAARTDAARERLVLEKGGRLLAAVAFEVKKPSEAHYRLELLVAPGAGDVEAVAGRLYRAIRERLEPLRPRALSVLLREDMTPIVSFFRKRGFVELERQVLARLDLASFDPSPLEAARQRVAAAGIRLVARADLPEPDGEANLRRLYRLVVELLEDVPHAEALDIWPFEVWRSRALTPARRPEGCFLALAGDDWVGLSELLLSDRSERLRTGLTGVRRGWRGRGVATALKLAALAYAKGRGAAEITTSNHHANRAMVAINERLGFRHDPPWITLKRELTPPAEGPS